MMKWQMMQTSTLVLSATILFGMLITLSVDLIKERA